MASATGSRKLEEEARPLAAGESVLLDGVAVPASELAAARRVNPGKHTVVFRLGPEVRRDLELKEGEARDVALPAEDTKPEVAAPVTFREEPRRMSPLTYLGFGVAAGGVLVGSITGLTAFSKTTALSNACSPNGDCPPSRDSDIRGAKTMGTISTISFAVAGTGAVVGVLGLLGVGAKPSTPATQGTITPVVGLGSVGLIGSF